jgi:predicted ATP-grasp superfamily ATP-dependent carboligase
VSLSDPVLITSGNPRSALAVARSLHAHGIDVIALSAEGEGYATRSRAIRRVYGAPAPAGDPAGFAQAVRAVACSHGVSLVIPITDDDLLALDLQRAALAGLRLAMAPAASVRNVLDKRANLALASSLGIPVPRSFELHDLGQLPEMIETLGWPIVMKTPGSRLDPRVPKFDFRVYIAQDVADLLRAIDRWCAPGRYPIFQEFVHGQSMNLVGLAVGGEVVAMHQYQSVRAAGGQGILRRAIAADPALEAHARRILRELRWEGVAHVGFLANHATGKVGYMEVNGRFWASTQGSVDAGWDFPWWTYRYFVHGESPQVPRLRLGSETVWRYGDLQALVHFLKGGPSPTPGRHPTRGEAIRDFLRGYVSGARSETFRWNDPGPGLLDARSALRDALQLLSRKLGRGTALPDDLAVPRPGLPAPRAVALPAAEAARSDTRAA